MPRIRTIKPEFWGDEKLAPMAPIDRLVFLGLWSMADDTGRITDSIRAIDGFIFPLTTDSAATSLDALAANGRIERGETSSGQRIIQIVNWRKHQKIDKPNLASALPPIVGSRRAIPQKLRDAVFERDGGICQLCSKTVRRSKRDKYDAGSDLAEVDHIIPAIEGGKTVAENLRLLCLACNRERAGDDVRRRNHERSANDSAKDRGGIVEGSTPHTYDQRSTTYDRRPTTEDLKAPRKDLGTPRAPEDDPPPASNASLASPFAALRDLSHDAPAVAEFVRRFYPRASTAAERRTSVATQLLATLNGGAQLKGQRVVAYSLDRLNAKCREVLDEGVRDPDKAIVVLLTKLADTSDGAAPGAIAAAEVQRERVQSDAERARELVDANAWLEEHADVEAAVNAQLERDGFPAELPADDVRIIGRRIARESLVLAAYRRRAPDPASAPVETA